MNIDFNKSYNGKTRKQMFEEKIFPEPNTGCWIWSGTIVRGGYGYFGVSKNKNLMAHKVSYILFNGEIPSGMCVLHTCDVPCCVNPDHLFLGTHTDNMKDMVKKGRKARPKGEDFNRKLKETDVLSIRSMGASGYRHKEISKTFNISLSMVSFVINRKFWKHL